MPMLKSLIVTGLLLSGSALPLLAHADLFEALPKEPPIPKDNPMTPAKINLGRQLYFDPRLSSTNKVSCQSCHNVMAGGEDNHPVSTGVNGKKGTRSAPTVWNSAFLTAQFWDGRAPSLEEQAKGPMINPVEMGNPDHFMVVSKIAKVAGYKKEFREVFGDGPITIDEVAKAIAAYERTLVTPDSPFDRYVGGDKKALSSAAQRGMKAVQEVGCVSCHNGRDFAGPELASGTPFLMRFPTFPGSEYEKKYHLADDLGRYTVTHNEADKHMFRVPTWRNIALTAPYFHNGSVKTLDEAVRVMAKVQLGKTLTSDQVSDIVAFLKSLTGKRPHEMRPRLPQ